MLGYLVEPLILTEGFQLGSLACIWYISLPNVFLLIKYLHSFYILYLFSHISFRIFLIKIFLKGFSEEISFAKGVFLQCIFLLIYFQKVHSKFFFPRHLCQRFCDLNYFCKGVISLQGVFS